MVPKEASFLRVIACSLLLLVGNGKRLILPLANYTNSSSLQNGKTQLMFLLFGSLCYQVISTHKSSLDWILRLLLSETYVKHWVPQNYKDS